MSILIKGMEMPTNCSQYPCSDDDSRYCRAANKYIPMLGRPSWCPLVEVPPHGRLIDADALKMSIAFAEKTAEWAVPALRAVLMVIDEMPTIIEAEEGAEE